MSDYMFMLESHLNPDQFRVVQELRAAAAALSLNIYLTGGAMRDMLGGFPIRDLDFAVEGDVSKLAKEAQKRSTGVAVIDRDPHRHVIELLFPGDIPVELGLARQEQYAKPGARPQVSPATIHENLMNRDFTINAIALSLNAPSLGLLIDPTNGLADLEHKELRTVHSYALYDDPVRILRLERLRVRLGFTLTERTRQQLENARLSEVEKLISQRRRLAELKHIAAELNPAAVVEALDQAGLLTLFSPVLTGPKANHAGFQKYHKAMQMVPFSAGMRLKGPGLFLYTLTEKLTAKEKADMVKKLGMEKEDVDAWQKLDSRSRKLEKQLQAGSMRPSGVYLALMNAPLEETLFLLLYSEGRLVQERIKHYLQRYVPTAQEVVPREVIAEGGGEPGTPKFEKVRLELIKAYLDGRRKRAVPPPPDAESAEPAAPAGPRGRFRSRGVSVV
jgi:tRNA nucleotidyltransferase (CCA-adding enzyme)